MCDWANLDETVGETGTSQEGNSCSIKTLPEEVRKEPSSDWDRAAAEQPRKKEGNSRDDIEGEAEWIESTPIEMLDRHATQIIVTAGSKRWWTKKVEDRQKEY